MSTTAMEANHVGTKGSGWTVTTGGHGALPYDHSGSADSSLGEQGAVIRATTVQKVC